MRRAYTSSAALALALLLALPAQLALAGQPAGFDSNSNSANKEFTLPVVNVPTTSAVLTKEHWQQYQKTIRTAATTGVKTTPVHAPLVHVAKAFGTGSGHPKNRRMLQQTQDSGPIEYFGGPVLTDTVNVYMIYVDNSQADLSVTWSWTSWPTYFVSVLGGSPRWQINHAYYDSQGNYISGGLANPANAQVTVDNFYFTNDNLPGLIQWVLDHGYLPVDNYGIYVVATAAEIGEAMDPQYCVSGGWCAFHSANTIGNYGNINYAFVPMPGGSACSTGCVVPDWWYQGYGSATGNPYMDHFLSNLYHELSETVTDPDTRTGWMTASTPPEENGDLCNEVYGQMFTTTYQGETVAYNAWIGQTPVILQLGWNPQTQQCVDHINFS